MYRYEHRNRPYRRKNKSSNERILLARRTRAQYMASKKTAHSQYSALNFFKFLVAVFFLVFAVYQCVQRIQHYRLDPSEINTYYIENDTVRFPSITLCPFKDKSMPPSVNPFLLRQAMENPEEKDPNVIFNDLGLNGYWNVSALHLKFIEYVADTVMYHDENDVELVKHILILNSNVFDYQKNWDISLRATQLVYRNTRPNPCEENPKVVAKCLVDCIEKRIYTSIKDSCRLPYMQHAGNMSPCENFAMMKKMISGTLNVMFKFHRNGCMCPKKCRETVFSLEFLSGLPISEIGPNTFRVSILFPNPRITVVEEASSYGLGPLCADIGGSIGLFLGIGAWQLFDLILAALLRASKIKM